MPWMPVALVALIPPTDATWLGLKRKKALMRNRKEVSLIVLATYKITIKLKESEKKKRKRM